MTFIDQIVEEIAANPIAVKMSYPDRLPEKIEKLLDLIPDPPPTLAPFFEVILCNPALKASHLENALKFLRSVPAADRPRLVTLFALLWPQPDPDAFAVGLSENKPARTALSKATLERIDELRKFAKEAPTEAWDAVRLQQTARALRISGTEVLRVVACRPRILRGLRKPPRPRYACILPVLTALVILTLLLFSFPSLPLWAFYVILLPVLLVGTWIISTRVPIAPGVLYYEPTRRRLQEILHDGWQVSGVVEEMEKCGIDADAYQRARQYAAADGRCRIEIRDKRTFAGAMQFLTSSEEIGNCIALRNFVSWCLPSLLDDESIVLADVYTAGSTRGWHQRAQLWMVAAQADGVPILTVNSVEFNHEGVKFLDELLPEMILVLQDVARRAGFREIYVGISDYGREWLDAHYPQGECSGAIVKIHHPDLGDRYYFDSFHRRAGRWEFMKQRTLMARVYALVFGGLAWLERKPEKARAFLNTARNVHNFWAIPVTPATASGDSPSAAA